MRTYLLYESEFGDDQTLIASFANFDEAWEKMCWYIDIFPSSTFYLDIAHEDD